METSLKPGFAQIFSCCPKNLSCPKFGGAAAPLPPGPYAYAAIRHIKRQQNALRHLVLTGLFDVFLTSKGESTAFPPPFPACNVVPLFELP